MKAETQCQNHYYETLDIFKTKTFIYLTAKCKIKREGKEKMFTEAMDI